MPNETTAVMTEPQQGRVAAISQAKTFSNRSCPKTSTGSPSRRSHLRYAWLSSSVSHRKPAPTRSGSVPHGVKLLPHRHPEDRVYTVISGVFYIGLGDQFNPDKLEAYPAGSVIVLPGNTSHFHWAKSSEYVTQVTAIGPLGLEYLSANDDPRNHNS
jgi:quercetin dioxygenase-like cupin family protein